MLVPGDDVSYRKLQNVPANSTAHRADSEPGWNIREGQQDFHLLEQRTLTAHLDMHTSSRILDRDTETIADGWKRSNRKSFLDKAFGLNARDK